MTVSRAVANQAPNKDQRGRKDLDIHIPPTSQNWQDPRYE